MGQSTLRISAILVAIAVSRVDGAPPITAAAFTPDGKQIVAGSQLGVEIRSVPELAVVKSFATDLANVHDLAFSPDSKTLLVVGGSPAEVGLIEVLDWPSGRHSRQVKCHDDVVYRVAWSADGTRWSTASADGECQVFDALSRERLIRYTEHSRAVLAIAFLIDGKSIVSAGVDQTVRLWDATTGLHIRTLDNHVAAVNGIAVRPRLPNDELPIVATIGEDRTVRLWQPTIGRLMRFARIPSIPRAVAWSANGSHLLVGCHDGRVRVLDFDSMDVVKTHDGNIGRIYELQIEPTAAHLLIAGERGVQLLEEAQAK
jgi:WD40 repeat protein